MSQTVPTYCALGSYLCAKLLCYVHVDENGNNDAINVPAPGEKLIFENFNVTTLGDDHGHLIGVKIEFTAEIKSDNVDNGIYICIRPYLFCPSFKENIYILYSHHELCARQEGQ